MTGSHRFRIKGILERSMQDSGFTLAEFLISTLLLLIIAGAVFSLLGETQQTASYQTEVQAVMENARIAMDTVERYVRQAGNDPKSIGFQGVSNMTSTSVTLKSDLTGSASSSGYPDKGDPDGDTSDANEDATLQYNSTAKTLEVVPNGGSAQGVAGYITNFSLQYYDAAGAITTDGASVRKISVSIICTSALPNPRTKQFFSIQMNSDIQLATRQ